MNIPDMRGNTLLSELFCSEMISPTLIMDTELDTDTDDDDDDDDDDDTLNIYEEVLNGENYDKRQHHSRLSTSSSPRHYWGYARSTQYQVRPALYIPF